MPAGAVAELVAGTRAVATGIIGLDGVLRNANAGLTWLLGGDEGSPASLQRLRAPRVERLLVLGSAAADGALVHEGVLSFGDMAAPGHSLRGRVRRQGDALLLLASFDVEELEQMTSAVSALNTEVTSLQRDLMAERRGLQVALASLKEAQNLLVHAEKMTALGQLVAGIAHELNNPLAFVASNVHSLSRSMPGLLRAYGALDAAARAGGSPGLQATAERLWQEADADFLRDDLGDLLAGTLEGVARTQQIVLDLRSFSALDEAENQRVDLTEHLLKTVRLARASLAARGIEVELDLPPLPGVPCQPAALNQAFLNLLVNAGHAVAERAAPGGRITLRARDGADAVEVDVEDNGCGMSEEVSSQIFDPFFTTRPVGSGTGLGLSLVHTIVVTHHRGTVSVASTPGEGTCFTVRLPRSAERNTTE